MFNEKSSLLNFETYRQQPGIRKGAQKLSETNLPFNFMVLLAEKFVVNYLIALSLNVLTFAMDLIKT